MKVLKNWCKPEVSHCSAMDLSKRKDKIKGFSEVSYVFRQNKICHIYGANHSHRHTQAAQRLSFHDLVLRHIRLRVTVGWVLLHIVQEGRFERFCWGAFVRPRKSRFVGNVVPIITEIAQAIARDNGETVQVHGTKAARHLGFST